MNIEVLQITHQQAEQSLGFYYCYTVSILSVCSRVEQRRAERSRTIISAARATATTLLSMTNIGVENINISENRVSKCCKRSLK